MFRRKPFAQRMPEAMAVRPFLGPCAKIRPRQESSQQNWERGSCWEDNRIEEQLLIFD
jgi:hypothetical protein